MSPVELPSNAAVNVTSEGRLDRFKLHASINSNLGNIEIDGTAGIQEKQYDINDIKVNAQGLQAGRILSLPWLGSSDLSMLLDGTIGASSDLTLSGNIDKVYLNQNPIVNTRINAQYLGNSMEMKIDIEDPQYGMNLSSQMTMDQQTSLKSSIELNDFRIGKLVDLDSSLVVSSKVASDLVMDQQSISLDLELLENYFKSSTVDYNIDSFEFDALLAPEGSELHVLSDHSKGTLTANFDIRQAAQLVRSIREGQTEEDDLSRLLNFNFELTAEQPLKLLIPEIESASDLQLSGFLDESNQTFKIGAQTGKFQGYGVTIDTLFSDLEFNRQEILADVLVENILYDSIRLGDLSLQAINSNGQGVNTRFLLDRDSLTLMKITADLQFEEDQILVKLDSLVSLNQQLTVDSNNPIVIASQNVRFDRFTIRGQQLSIDINGTMDEFEFTIDDADLTHLNMLFPSDSTWIHHGRLNGLFAWVEADKKVHIQTNIDSLTIKDSPSLDITARAFTEGSRVPFSLQLNSITNNIGLSGDYSLDNSQIAANLNVDINQLKTFDFLVADKVEFMDGKISGQIDIGGKLTTPDYRGELAFHEVQLITLKPRSSFFIKDEVLRLDNSGLTLQDFNIYDSEQNSLKINGKLSTENYRDFDYNLTVETDNYLLINNPRQDEYQIQGQLVVGSNFSIQEIKRTQKLMLPLLLRILPALLMLCPLRTWNYCQAKES